MKNILIAVVLFSFYACSNQQNKETESEKPLAKDNWVILSEEQMKAEKIQFSPLEQTRLSSEIQLNGKIDVPPQNLVSVSMPLGGFLQSTQLLPGMHINKGQIIAVMEDRSYIELQQNYLSAKSKLQFAEKDYQRQLELNQEKASSDKILQTAELELKSQQLTVAALAEQLKLIHLDPKTLTEANISKSVNVYSPINGFVSKVNANIGKYLNPTDVLFELVNPEDIHLNLNVFEKDLNKISIGQKLIAFNNQQPGKVYPCEIILISKDISGEGTAEVHCHFEEYDKTLLPGMYMNAKIEISNHLAMATTEEAIVNFEGSNYVFVHHPGNKFEMKKVETGVSENGKIEILNHDDFRESQIVTVGAYTLLMALKNAEE